MWLLRRSGRCKLHLLFAFLLPTPRFSARTTIIFLFLFITKLTTKAATKEASFFSAEESLKSGFGTTIIKADQPEVTSQAPRRDDMEQRASRAAIFQRFLAFLKYTMPKR